MAIQIGEKKKKQPKLLILLIIVLLGFVGFRVFKMFTAKPVMTNTEINVGEDISLNSAISNVNDILQDPKFQVLYSHHDVSLQPLEIGKEDPFAK